MKKIVMLVCLRIMLMVCYQKTIIMKNTLIDFFLSLGSARSKKLIKLLCRIEKEQNRIFKAELVSLWLYIRELYSPNIKYSDEVGTYVGGYHFSKPSIDQQYEKIKTQLEHTLNFV
ncbi:P52 family lipoprotein [Borreliella garinii]|uniref:P52 family lipoprotein n=4 Tax=Borreliella garinii TaxID=29519 RepID=UPI001AEDB4DF|nr:P52 family lipoprotein [Borreliella garinii]